MSGWERSTTRFSGRTIGWFRSGGEGGRCARALRRAYTGCVTGPERGPVRGFACRFRGRFSGWEPRRMGGGENGWSAGRPGGGCSAGSGGGMSGGGDGRLTGRDTGRHHTGDTGNRGDGWLSGGDGRGPDCRGLGQSSGALLDKLGGEEFAATSGQRRDSDISQIVSPDIVLSQTLPRQICPIDVRQCRIGGQSWDTISDRFGMSGCAEERALGGGGCTGNYSPGCCICLIVGQTVLVRGGCRVQPGAPLIEGRFITIRAEKNTTAAVLRQQDMSGLDSECLRKDRIGVRPSQFEEICGCAVHLQAAGEEKRVDPAGIGDCTG